MRQIWRLLKIVFVVFKLGAKLGVVSLSLLLMKRRAIRAYRRKLREEGLPEPLIKALAECYIFKLRELFRQVLKRG